MIFAIHHNVHSNTFQKTNSVKLNLVFNLKYSICDSVLLFLNVKLIIGRFTKNLLHISL